MPIPCRSIAICASSPRGRRRRKKRACRTGSTAMSMRRRIIRSGAGAATSARRSTRSQREGRVPILVGGTGLYFKALTSGLAAVPPIPADIRAQVRGRLASEGAAALHAELMQRDPATAQRLMPNDRSRISRALEVVLATGRSLYRLAPRRHAGAGRSDARRENLSHLRAQATGRADRNALRRHAEGRRARRGEGAWPRASSIRCCRR